VRQQHSLVKVAAIAGAVVVLLAVGPSAAKADYLYTTFDPSGSTHTFVTAINNSGMAAGFFYVGDQGHISGFIRDAQGKHHQLRPNGQHGHLRPVRCGFQDFNVKPALGRC
jgi:hypothetical protein